MVDVTNLTTLERRILHRLENGEEDEAQAVQEEFAKFETETERMGKEPDKIGQATLTSRELGRLPTGNQHSDTPTVIEWQCVKAAAIHYNVSDWISRVDSSLSYEENVSLLESLSQGDRELAVEEANMRWARSD